MPARPWPRRVCVVGSGTRFLSGISVYTVRLANALAASRRVSLITMRQLLPTRFYPGRSRVGVQLTGVVPDPSVRVFDGVDWYWIPSIFRVFAFLLRERPDVMVLQWWTGTVLHTYLALALATRFLRIPLVIEFHEVIDTAEAKMRLASKYVGTVAPLVVRLASAYVVHSEFDRGLLASRYRFGCRPVTTVPLGPLDHYLELSDGSSPDAMRRAPLDSFNLLFFGVIRPYKGLEDLIAAFDRIPEAAIDRYWLTVVGETWEGWNLPSEMIASSRYRSRITFVNRYLHDAELNAHLRGADGVVLPYRRSSTSGPLHVAMSYGLPVVITDVGGNAEASRAYQGVFLVPPDSPEALSKAIQRLPDLGGRRFSVPLTWQRATDAYERLFDRLREDRGGEASVAGP